MEFSVPGFIKRYCQPNALLTLAEYLEDYAPAGTKEKGYRLIGEKLSELEEGPFRDSLIKKLDEVKLGRRDLYF